MAKRLSRRLPRTRSGLRPQPRLLGDAHVARPRGRLGGDRGLRRPDRAGLGSVLRGGRRGALAAGLRQASTSPRPGCRCSSCTPRTTRSSRWSTRAMLAEAARGNELVRVWILPGGRPRRDRRGRRRVVLRRASGVSSSAGRGTGGGTTAPDDGSHEDRSRSKLIYSAREANRSGERHPQKTALDRARGRRPARWRPWPRNRVAAVIWAAGVRGGSAGVSARGPRPGGAPSDETGRSASSSSTSPSASRSWSARRSSSPRPRSARRSPSSSRARWSGSLPASSRSWGSRCSCTASPGCSTTSSSPSNVWIGFLVEALFWFCVAAGAGFFAYRSVAGRGSADAGPGDRGGAPHQGDSGGRHPVNEHPRTSTSAAPASPSAARRRARRRGARSRSAPTSSASAPSWAARSRRCAAASPSSPTGAARSATHQRELAIGAAVVGFAVGGLIALRRRR